MGQGHGLEFLHMIVNPIALRMAQNFRVLVILSALGLKRHRGLAILSAIGLKPYF